MPAITLVATAIDTNGPPGTARKPSRTTAKAGSAATTAPKPTRLAVFNSGSTDAVAPASTDFRQSASRWRNSTSGAIDGAKPGSCALRCPWASSAVSKFSALAPFWRTISASPGASSSPLP